MECGTKMGNDALPEHLRGKLHHDFPPGLRWIPRAWTSYKFGEPKKLLGNQPMEGGVLKPIGGPSTFQVSWYPRAPWWAKVTGLAFYVAWSGKRKEDGKFRHFRLGSRWDNVDSYVTILSVATRRFDGTDKQDTST